MSLALPSGLRKQGCSQNLTPSSRAPCPDIGMKITAVAGSRDEAGADDEIPEMLVGPASGGVGRKYRIKPRDDGLMAEVLAVELGEPRAVEGSAEIEVVAARTFSHEPDLGQIRPRAAVRAAGHANDDVVFGKAVRGKPRLERLEKTGQIALALRQREPAGGQRDAGHGVAAQPRGRRGKAVLPRDLLNRHPSVCTHAGDDQVLVGSDAQIAVMELGDPAQRGELLGAGSG